MRQEPWLESDIWAVMLQHFDYYLFFGPWIFAAGAIVLFLLLQWALVWRCNPQWSYNLFPSAHYEYASSDRPALLFAAAIFVLYTAVMYAGENSILSNLDLMHIGNMTAYQKGITPVYSSIRMSPLSFWDLNALYAITHNFYLINFYTAAKMLLILYLAYCLLDFVPVSRRLYGLGLTLLLPSLFWLNSVAFPEQNALIAILLSLSAWRKFARTRRYRWLLVFLLTMNWAIWTKETIVVFYACIAAVTLVQALLAERINLRSFLHPFRTMAQFPAEWLIFWSAFIFTSFYKLLQDAEGANIANIYVSAHQQDFFATIQIYALSLLLLAAAVGVMLRQKRRQKNSNYPQAAVGLLLGALAVDYLVVFYYGITPTPAYKPYYLVFSDIVALWWLISADFRWRKVLLGLLAAACLLTDAVFAGRELGRARREAVEFLLEDMQGAPAVVYMPLFSAGELWQAECWNSALNYLAPQQKLLFKNNIGAHWVADSYMHTIVTAEPVKGDYILLINGKTISLPSGAVKMFASKAAEIYKLQ